MSAQVISVDNGSFAERAGIKAGDILLSVNSHRIEDVFDYQFYTYDNTLDIEIEREGKKLHFNIKKSDGEYIGLNFETYLMDEQKSCYNKCIFCFVDQTPKGMRPSLYFKDDDTRMSFLFGNYTTLTNLKDGDIERIIKMHISPINISVHTTNPELRCKMLHNRFAGEAIKKIKRLADAAIEAISLSYAPYSNFNVGAAIMFEDGEILKGSNQENAAYPSGLCAERTALFYASSSRPDTPIKALAIAAGQNGKLCKTPATPCGACRQVMSQYQFKSGIPMSILLVGEDKIWKFSKVEDLLPFMFDSI